MQDERTSEARNKLVSFLHVIEAMAGSCLAFCSRPNNTVTLQSLKAEF